MSNFNEQLKNAKGLLHGEYRALVVDVADPDGLMRAQVRLIPFWNDLSDTVLPWAEYKLPIGARFNEGGFEPCLVGDLVWVDFINGDTRCPRITGSCHYTPDGTPNMPHESFVGEDIHTHKRDEAEPIPPAPIYHEAIVFSRFGVLIEIAPDSSYRLTHKLSGTAFEFTKDGESVLHTEGDSYRSGTGKLIENFDGDWSLNIDGKVNINATGHVELIAPSVDVGIDDKESAVLGAKFDTFLKNQIKIFNSHTHIGNMGAPTSVPDSPQAHEDCLSKTVNVQA
jgi:hypothetical protein